MSRYPLFPLLVMGMVAMLGTANRGCAATLPVHWEEPLVIDSGEAYRGPWRMNESEFLFVDDPTVFVNDDNVIAVAWGDLARKDILLQIYENDGTPRFGEPVNVSRSPDIFSWLSKMVITPGDADQVFVLWQEIVFSGGHHGGEIFFARSGDGGRTFTAPVNLSNTRAGAGKGRLTARRWVQRESTGPVDAQTGREQGRCHSGRQQHLPPGRQQLHSALSRAIPRLTPYPGIHYHVPRETHLIGWSRHTCNRIARITVRVVPATMARHPANNVFGALGRRRWRAGRGDRDLRPG